MWLFTPDDELLFDEDVLVCRWRKRQKHETGKAVDRKKAETHVF